MQDKDNRQKIQEDIELSNTEEAEDYKYQEELLLWETTLSDGLG